MATSKNFLEELQEITASRLSQGKTVFQVIMRDELTGIKPALSGKELEEYQYFKFIVTELTDGMNISTWEFLQTSTTGELFK